DFGLLKQALSAGAGAMLSKPYRMKDLAELVSLAALLEKSLRLESEETTREAEPVRLWCPSGPTIDSFAVAALSRFAKSRAAEPIVVERTLPLIAIELMENAATHGSAGLSSARYQVMLDDAGDDLELTVTNQGVPFNWQKVLARAKTSMQKSRASGLQLIVALARELTYRDGGREARALIAKREGVNS
ncbi:MAG: ATP-binding protein, partial [bacterium]|nr:ATP-binding protein [bacterium]